MKFALLFVYGMLLCFGSELYAQGRMQYAYCWGIVDDYRICKAAEPLDDDVTLVCKAFAHDIGAGSYGYRFSEDLDYLEQTMGQHCDEVRDGGVGEVYACMLEHYCDSDAEREVKNLASRVYADSYEAGVAKCMDMNRNRVIREIRKQSALGCYIKIKLEVFEMDSSK